MYINSHHMGLRRYRWSDKIIENARFCCVDYWLKLITKIIHIDTFWRSEAMEGMRSPSNHSTAHHNNV